MKKTQSQLEEEIEVLQDRLPQYLPVEHREIRNFLIKSYLDKLEQLRTNYGPSAKFVSGVNFYVRYSMRLPGARR